MHIAIDLAWSLLLLSMLGALLAFLLVVTMTIAVAWWMVRDARPAVQAAAAAAALDELARRGEGDYLSTLQSMNPPVSGPHTPPDQFGEGARIVQDALRPPSQGGRAPRRCRVCQWLRDRFAGCSR